MTLQLLHSEFPYVNEENLIFFIRVGRLCAERRNTKRQEKMVGMVEGIEAKQDDIKNIGLFQYI
jgi:hypothetical protein